jgi:SAM-dependent methyltransferase
MMRHPDVDNPNSGRPAARVDTMGVMPRCEICHGEEFRAGPKRRMGANGQAPACVRCGSLERHRIARSILVALNRDDDFRPYRVIQFSDDPTLDRSWFAEVERSQYGGANSIDVQDIPRPDGAYDFIMCSHVVEHVVDYRCAITELVRILSDRGLMLLAYPLPVTRTVTDDWGYPDPIKHDHYRVIGRDFEAEYPTLVPDSHVVAVTGTDDVTTTKDRIYLITKSDEWMGRIHAAGLDIETVATPRL